MNCNLKNKTVAVIALTFAFAFAVNSMCFAADENVAANAENSTPSSAVEEVVNAVEAPLAEAAQKIDDVADEANKAAQNASEQEAAALADIAKLNSEIKQVKDELKDLNIENPLPDEENAEGAEGEGNKDATNPLLDVDPSQVDDELPIDNSDPFAADSPIAEDFSDLTENEQDGSEIPAAEAPKSPLESFGNAILSKVDNNLFNQMSRIEKQTTLLNLELKRETLKNQVVALRQMRTKMLEEEAERKRALEAKIKEEEIARQAKILEEERKLKEREIELEKLRQAKVINDYMNEMLMMNQQWVEKNAKLQNRIHELEDERVELIETFKVKMETLGTEIKEVHEKAKDAADKHVEVVAKLNSKIDNLKTSIKNLRVELRESNIKIRDLQKQLQEAAANPFRGAVVKDVTQEVNYDDFGLEDLDSVPDKEDKDITKLYAIEEIIGNDNELIAKLVDIQNSADEKVKEFIVRKGTVMKDGSVVTSITEKYVIFETSDGERSYLYPGSITMDFEPEDSKGISKIDATGEKLAAIAKPEDNAEQEQEKLSETGKKERASKSTTPTKTARPKKSKSPTKTIKSKKKSSSSSSKSSKSSKSSSSSSKQPKGRQAFSPPSFGRGMFME